VDFKKLLKDVEEKYSDAFADLGYLFNYLIHKVLCISRFDYRRSGRYTLVGEELSEPSLLGVDFPSSLKLYPSPVRSAGSRDVYRLHAGFSELLGNLSRDTVPDPIHQKRDAQSPGSLPDNVQKRL